MADSGFTYRIDPGPAKRGSKEVVKAFADIEKATKSINARTINNTQRFAQALNKLSSSKGPTAASVRNTAKLAESLTNFRAPSPAQIRNMRDFFSTLSRRSDNANVVRGLDRIATSSGRVAEQASHAARELRAMHQEASKAAQRGGRFSAAVGTRATPAAGGRSAVEQARELSHAQENLSRSTSRAGSSARRASKNTGNLNTTVRELTSASVLAAGPLSQVGARVQALGSIASRTSVTTAALIGSVVGLAAGMGALAAASARSVLRMEKYEAMLTTVTSSQERTNKELQSLMITAKNFGLTFDSLAQQYARIRAAGESVNMTFSQTREIFDGFITATSALRLTAAETSGVFRALEQMISKGRVQAEELRGQLGERLPGAFGIAAKAMDATTAELNKMLETGQVAAEDLLPKMSDLLKDMFSERARENADSLQGSLNNLNNSFFELTISFAEATNLEQILTSALQGMISVMDSVTRNMDELIETAKVLASVLGGALAGIAVRSVLIPAVTALVGALTNLRAVMTGIASLRFGATLAAIGGAAGPIGALIGGAAFALGAFASKADDIARVREEIEATGDAIERISSDALRDPLRTISSVEEAIGRIQNRIKGFSDQYSMLGQQTKITLEEVSAASKALAQNTGPMMPGANENFNTILEGGKEVERAARARKELTEERKDAQKELIRLEKERQNLLASSMEETFLRAEILGIQNATELVERYGEEWRRVLKARREGKVDAGFSTDLQERLFEVRDRVKEMTTPLSDIKSLIDNMGDLADKIAPPEISEERQRLVAARESINKVSEAQQKSARIAANLGQMIQGLTNQREGLKIAIQAETTSEEAAAGMRSQVASITRELTDLEFRHAQALDNENLLLQKQKELQEAVTTARSRAKEDLQQQIARSKAYAAAVREGSDAVETFKKQEETLEKVKEVQSQMALAFGESWTKSAEAVKLYTEAVASIGRDARSEALKDQDSPMELLRSIDPLTQATEEYRNKMASLNRVKEAGLITDQRAIELQNRFKKELEESVETYYGVGEAARRAEEAANELGMTFSSAFEDAVIEGENLRNTVNALGKDIARLIMRQGVTKPLAGTISNFAKTGFSSLLNVGGTQASSGGAAMANALLAESANGNFFTGPSITRVSERGNPEAVLPLTRMNGKLGVESSGGSSNVIVNIYNEGGEQMEQTGQRSRRGPNGDQVVDVMVKSSIERLDSNGQLDGVFRRHGANRRSEF